MKTAPLDFGNDVARRYFQPRPVLFFVMSTSLPRQIFVDGGEPMPFYRQQVVISW